MTKLDLNFLQRFKLSDLLSQQEGPLGRTAPFLRVLNLVRFDDAESAQIKTVKVSDSQVRFEAPTADFGEKSVDLETADGKALLDLIENWPKFTTPDHVWADPLVEQLSKK